MNIQRKTRLISLSMRVLLVLTFVCVGLQWSAFPAAAAYQLDLLGPIGSGRFGLTVTVLSNGNFVVTDPSYDSAGKTNLGAVYLYDGASGTLISTLTGSHDNDQVGSGGVTPLNNGNFVVRSPLWTRQLFDPEVGAVTWGSGVTGVSGEVSSANSLVGTKMNDRVGSGGVTPLSNGNYVVSSPLWNNLLVADAGAVTWGNGATGVSGAVSSANSLVGSAANDEVGYAGVVALSNGSYVVLSPDWDNGGIADVGAATWGSGTSGVSGPVSPANSLVGSSANDSVGDNGVTALSNGNYVVTSEYWNNGGVSDVGAATWGSGATGVSGPVSPANSLVGSTADDRVGNRGVVALNNSNYLVCSSYWNNGASTNAGAVTWGSGTTGVSGAVTSVNSLVGNTTNDLVGNEGVTALSNGNYVVISDQWNNGASTDAGAVTWGSGATGISGVVSPANSLVGSTIDDRIGNEGVVALSNGNYVVCSDLWDNGGMANVGAATWGSGISGVSGLISPTNSLVGSTAGDQVCIGGVTALSNGNYVVSSFAWSNGGVSDIGAATWGNGATGITGSISSANSLVGSTADDRVGVDGVVALSNGNYVVVSSDWNNLAVWNAGAVTWGSGTTGVSGVLSPANSLVGSSDSDSVGEQGVVALTNGSYVVCSEDWVNGGTGDVGAVTWGNGAAGVSGAVSPSNSLVGSTDNDRVGSESAVALSNGDYAVYSPRWDYGGTANAGAVSWGRGRGGTTGPVMGDNSVRGSAIDGGYDMVFAFDPVNGQLIVGRPDENIVSLFKLPYLYLPVVTR